MNYEKIYNDIISKARSEDRKKIKGGIYYEAHHIIPKCLGGEGNAYDIRHPNIVLLTAKEHYMAHRLLCEIYPDNNKLRYALWMMINGSSKYNKRYTPSSRVYESVKVIHSKFLSSRTISEETKKKLSRPKKGHSEETRKKMSDAAKNRKPKGGLSVLHKKKISESMTGRSISAETKRKISKANMGHIVSEETRLKLSIARRKRVITEETKHKLSLAAKNRKYKNKTKI